MKNNENLCQKFPPRFVIVLTAFSFFLSCFLLIFTVFVAAVVLCFCVFRTIMIQVRRKRRGRGKIMPELTMGKICPIKNAFLLNAPNASNK